MIELQHVRKTYQTDRIETLALSEIDLAIPKGEFLSIMGPSGSGKSTLLHLIGLLDTPTSGLLRVAGHDASRAGDAALARLRNTHIGFVFQTFHLVPDLSVADNVEIPLLYRSGERKLSAKERRERALAALDRVGLSFRSSHFPNQLSGGQQQRVAIARAIVGGPSLLLADEPTGNLDSRMGDEIVGILEDLNRKDETTVVMVTHDPRMAARTARTVRLFDGRLVN
ncbi:MAG: ABC transporter ATP-binding protein [Thermoanaerobaculia bacterium]|jgi:putative ABC transport system ATP-binding protein|nr:ABC transporter ATP-binding protein [Thermoanaerobaculia bacterium]